MRPARYTATQREVIRYASMVTVLDLVGPFIGLPKSEIVHGCAAIRLPSELILKEHDWLLLIAVCKQRRPIGGKQMIVAALARGENIVPSSAGIDYEKLQLLSVPLFKHGFDGASHEAQQVIHWMARRFMLTRQLPADDTAIGNAYKRVIIPGYLKRCRNQSEPVHAVDPSRN